MTVVFSPAAEADLLEIADYIAEDSPRRAATFVDELEEKCEAAGRTPGIGTERPELGDGIRMLPHGRYLVFYREADGGVRIERVLHSARDIGGKAFDA
jgi:toxin ParE1/3/4